MDVMGAAQVFEGQPRQRLRAVGPRELPAAAGIGGRIGRTLASLPRIGELSGHAGEGLAEPLIASGIRPAMHRWEIPRRERFAWRARIHANPASSLTYRIGVGVVGALLLVLAALTGWLPGPGGIPLFLIGMAVLASEFRWAHRITVGVMMTVRRVECWSTRAKAIGVCVFVALAAVLLYVVLLFVGVPSWAPGWAARLLSRVPGLR